FDDVVSQDHVISTLRNAIAQNRISHAYLFCGPRGVGKTTMARVVARMINGVGMDVDGEELGRTLDIIEIDAASNSGVDDVRQLRDGVRVPPQNGTYKVYIIDEVHMLSKQAFNALLKTLEEPPEYVKFIFATTEPHKVLPTVLSRCQRFDFRRIKVSEIVDRLRFICSEEGITIDDASLHVIARKADGALRDALSIMDQAIAFCGTNIDHEALLDALNVVSTDRLFEIIDCAHQKDARRAMEIIDKLLFEGHDIQEFLNSLTEQLRNLYLAQDAGSIRLIEATDDEKDRLKRTASNFSEQDLLRMLHMISEAQFKLRDAQPPRIQLEITMLRMVTMDRSEGLQQLLSEIRDLKKKLHESGSEGVNGSDSSFSEASVASKPVVKGNSDSPGKSASSNSHSGPAKAPSNGSRSENSMASSAVAPNYGSSATPTNLGAPDKISQAKDLDGAKTTSAVQAKTTESDSDSTPPVSNSNSQAESNAPAPNKSRSAGANSASAVNEPTSSNGTSDLLNNILGKSAIKRKGEPQPKTKAFTRSGVQGQPSVSDLLNKSATSKPKNEEAEEPPQTGNGFPENDPTDDYNATEDFSENNDDFIEVDSNRTVLLHEIKEAWPTWLEQVRQDCPQLVYFSLGRATLLDIKEKTVSIECQDELTLQMIRQNEQSLTACFQKVLKTSLYISGVVRKNQKNEATNDPYEQFKKLQQSEPKVRMIVDIFGAELEY
ncbi:MAG: DNA polymerase III subunit gamma/tau, partial [Balneolales bacterium]|nr:DNA polymerase III subunit gamma/tau [Balneolales bacterium]